MVVKKLFCLFCLIIFFNTTHSPVFAAENDDHINFGGALRFNYNLSSWKEGQKKRFGDFGYDMFRVNTTGSVKGIKLNAEYRFYSEGFGGGMLKQGWFGYDLSEKSEIQLGLQQVPFGIQQYNSHNWFFNLTYYLGFEDDHDMGVKYIHDNGNWQLQAAYYHNAEELVFGDVPASPNRYSYDITGRNKESSQLNIKAVRRMGTDNGIEAGVSVQGGLLYNLDTETHGTAWAGALHAELLPSASPWGLKLQIMGYKFNPEEAPGDTPGIIEMGAYGAGYNVASAGNIYSIAISHTVDIGRGLLEAITFYNDFAFLDKANSEFENTFMNVIGGMISSGPVYTYVDMAMGYNHPWLGPEWTNALAAGTAGTTSWHYRFNINFGYYF